MHFADIKQLLDVLHRLRDQGNTIVVIEHNLDVIKTADWIVDLGPEGAVAVGKSLRQAHRRRGQSQRFTYCEILKRHLNKRLEINRTFEHHQSAVIFWMFLTLATERWFGKPNYDNQGHKCYRRN